MNAGGGDAGTRITPLTAKCRISFYSMLEGGVGKKSKQLARDAPQQATLITAPSDEGASRPLRCFRSAPTSRQASSYHFGGCQLSFSNGRISQRHRAGRKTMAAIMFTTNMKVSIRPMSAWNFRSDQIHVATPTASVSAV